MQDFRDYFVTVIATSGSALTEAKFTLRVLNPCSETVGLPKESMPEWCPKDESTYWNPKLPVWMEVLHE